MPMKLPPSYISLKCSVQIVIPIYRHCLFIQVHVYCIYFFILSKAVCQLEYNVCIRSLHKEQFPFLLEFYPNLNLNTYRGKISVIAKVWMNRTDFKFLK